MGLWGKLSTRGSKVFSHNGIFSPAQMSPYGCLAFLGVLWLKWLKAWASGYLGIQIDNLPYQTIKKKNYQTI